MSDFMNDKYIVASGVLLCYTGLEEIVTVPSSIGGVPIHTIGQSAFAGNRSIKGVLFEEGIRTIRYGAFQQCRNLKYVTIPYSVKTVEKQVFFGCGNLEKVYQIMVFDDGEYERLLAGCARNGGGAYVAYEVPKIGDNCVLSDGALALGNVHRIPFGITRLFLYREPIYPEKVAPGQIPGLVNIFYPSGSGPLDEAEALKKVQDEGFPEPDEANEKENDEMDRRFLNTPIFPSRVFLFDEKKARSIGGKHCILAEHSIGYHFWQSMVPIKSDGKQYAVYNRCVLNASNPDTCLKDMDYVRIRTAVCDEFGNPETDRRRIWNVYAKYKLMRIL